MSTRSKPFWSRTGATTTTPSVIYLPNQWHELKLWVDVASYAQLGTTYVAPGVADVSGVTTLDEVGGPTGGSVVLRVFPNDSQATNVTVNYNDSAATIKTSLVNTNLFVAGDITAGGGALNSAVVTLTWTGVYAVTIPPIILLSNSLTGGSAGATVGVRTTTQPLGHGGYGYLEAATQEVWQNDIYGDPDLYLYVAAVTGAGNYRVTAYQ